MNRIFAFLSLLFLPFPVTNLGIIGGNRVPNVAFFVTIRITSIPVCGGTVIASDAVVTAAHCLYDFQTKNWYPAEFVHVSKRDFAHRNWLKDAKWFSCRRYTCHKSYDPNRNDGLLPFDVAVIHLNEQIYLNQPINGKIKPCPATVEYLQGIFVGMGLTQRKPEIEAEVLMGIRLYRLPCPKFFKEVGVEIEEDKQSCFRGAVKKVPVGPSDGDSGGPLIYYNPINKRGCLIGIASFSSESSGSPYIDTVFTRADYFSKWITDAISDKNISPQPGCCRVM